MSVVPERVHEFYEPPKPQVGTVLPRYGVENGYLVLEDFKTRDLPRPPPAGWDSANRLALFAAAALVIFVSVLVFALLRQGSRSDDDNKPADPALGRNDTNKTAAAAKFHIATEVEGSSTVQEAGVDSTAMPSRRYGLDEMASKRQKPPAAETALRRIVASHSRRSRLMSTLERLDEEDVTVTFGNDVSNDVAEDLIDADTLTRLY